MAFKCSGSKRAHPLRRPTQRSPKFAQDAVAGSSIIQFRAHSLLLRGVQMSSFGVAQQPVQTPRDVAHVKCHWSKTNRPSIDLRIGQIVAPLVDVFLRQFQRMQHSSCHGIDFRQRSSEPRFYGSIRHYNPFRARNARTTSPTSSCLPSTASFIARTSSALTLPASLSIATWISGCLASESSRTSGTASYGGK